MPNFTLNDQVFFDAASQFQTPFHLYTEEGIRQTARGLIRAFSGVPVFREYFAVKALPNPTVLRILKEEGCGLDCASQTELMLAEALGFRGDDIILSANDVPPAEFAYARRLGATINLDDITHVEILKNNGGIPEEICLRFNPGGDFRIGTQIMGNPGEAKYGMTRDQLTEALLKLKTTFKHVLYALNGTETARRSVKRAVNCNFVSSVKEFFTDDVIAESLRMLFRAEVEGRL